MIEADPFNNAQIAFENGEDSYWQSIMAFVMDSSGLMAWKAWVVNVLKPELQPTLLGDSTLDGTLNILDVVTTVNYIVGNIPLEEQATANADINQDGIIDILDIVSLVQEILPS